MRKRSTKVEILVDVFHQTYFRKFDENLAYPGLLNKSCFQKEVLPFTNTTLFVEPFEILPI